MPETKQSPPAWTPLAKLGRQFDANLTSLGKRDRGLADRLTRLRPKFDYHISPRTESVCLGRTAGTSAEMELLANPVPPVRAMEIVRKIYPQGLYTQPLLVAGLDQGWLWDAMYKLETSCPQAPGMRLPLYLMAADLERLWAVLHYHNWPSLLADERVRILAGPDAAEQFAQTLLREPDLCAPRMSLTVTPEIWADGKTFDGVMQEVAGTMTARLAELQRELAAGKSTAELVDSLRHGKLRVLGITSRYTTFLQHSMRDWLAALEDMGHSTRLLIEESDCKVLPAVVYAQVCKEFQPDLILVIDHYRAEMPGLPPNTPCVMWVQDRLPNIFNAAAGAAQGPNDYVIGYAMQECTRRWSYPVARFMPAMVGVNEKRFAPRTMSKAELAESECDVAFVSHASVPARVIVDEEIKKIGSPEARRLLEGIYRRLAEIYDGGDSITVPSLLKPIVESELTAAAVKADLQAVMDLVIHRINNALLRHQTIRWVAATGVDLRLYGRGWEAHPEFARYARGVADNQNQLRRIYQASRINLQVTPFGSAHQRLFEGLACGGFFLLRSVTGDAIELLTREAWCWCQRAGVRNGTEMARRGAGNATFQWIIAGAGALLGEDLMKDPEMYYAGLQEAALGGFSRCSSTLWPEYEKVSYWTQEELTKKLKHYLANAEDRRSIAESMRRRVVQWHTYSGISRRMLSFIADDQAGRQAPPAIAA
jgi:hypothetical protein